MHILSDLSRISGSRCTPTANNVCTVRVYTLRVCVPMLILSSATVQTYIVLVKIIEIYLFTFSLHLKVKIL